MSQVQAKQTQPLAIIAPRHQDIPGTQADSLWVFFSQHYGFSDLVHTQQTAPNLKVTQLHSQCLNMQFNLWTLPIHCQIWNLHNTQILIVHRSFGFVHLTYSKCVLQIFIVRKFDVKFRISDWICGYRIWIPIFEHYNCIANAFVRCPNLVLSAMLTEPGITDTQ